MRLKKTPNNIRATYHCQFFCFILLPCTQINYSFFSAAGDCERKLCLSCQIRLNALYWVYLEYEDNLIFMTFKMKKVQSKFEVVSTEFINWITFPNICNSDTCLRHVMLRASASNKMRMSGLSGQGENQTRENISASDFRLREFNPRKLNQ